MDGDLHRLKKVCLYASKVMLAGEAVLAGIIVLTLAMGAGSLASEGVSGLLEGWTSFLRPGMDGDFYAVAETVLILALGLVTVDMVRGFMDSVRREHSPFNQANIRYMRATSCIYLVSSVVLFAMEHLSGEGPMAALFMSMGALLICVVMYCLALAFEYGAFLQKESDETL